ncbi:HAD hydrolase family protein [Thalassobacillus sp. C254]|uniref:HAD hydrolase family protein n=1 Tax=Thalassobacillus sp. C254 TaxID=1225341 RepID=UPI0018DE3BA1|nr:HAD hydrolase family protein [Thalassobacillus sp. C254]
MNDKGGNAAVTYRLLALSIDGAVLRSNGRMAKETKEAIDFVRNKGVYVTLITNRTHHGAKKVAKLLKMEHEIISHGGAFIAGHVEKPIYEARMNPDLTYDVVEILERFSCQVQVENERFELANRHQQSKNLLGKMSVGLSESLFYPKTYVDNLTGHIFDHQIGALKIKGNFESREESKEAFEDLNHSIPGIKVRRKEQELEICREEASKENALAFLIRELGIQSEEVVMVGSKPDDIPSLKMTGLGVAMGQSPEEVKAEANWITRSNNQNGVPYMIKEVFRKQMKVDQP